MIAARHGIAIAMAAMANLALCRCATAAPAPSRVVTFELARQGTICVDVPGALKLVGTCRKRYGPTQQDRRLARSMRNADDTTAIFHYTDNGQTYLVFVVSVPSNRADRTGYCGAGYEDSLVSARIHGDRLRLTDRMLIQSCRESLALEDGRPDDIGRALAVDIELREVRLRRESSAHDTVIRMRSGAFQETSAP